MQLVSNKTSKLLAGALLAASLSVAVGNFSQALAATPDLDICPEVAAATWEENDQECATVTINGKDLITFRGETQAGSAEDRAEDVADKLKDLIDDGKLDATKLVPSSEGNLATIRMDGSTVLKFAVPESSDTSGSPANPSEGAIGYSYRVVNAIRCVLGAPQLPQSFLKLAESQGPDKAAVACMQKAAEASTLANFSPNFSGHASWYGGKFHGRRTSNGERYDQDGLTAAHRTLPFGTKLLVMNRKTGASCVVSVNDRGPFVDDRVIDLSRGAATKLKMLSAGVAVVDCMVLDPSKQQQED
jgi:rare lipoprotein A (peptidoglycan hydrolase)